MTTTRTAEYEILEHSKNDSIAATLWWDGKKVQCEPADFLEDIKDMNHIRFANSESWLHTLPQLFRSGYLMARKARK